MVEKQLKELGIEEVVLVLQGGGALGAFQLGVFDGLQQKKYPIDWVVGISIGAINAAIIAGNKPKDRQERLHYFWQKVSRNIPFMPFNSTPMMQKYHNYWSAQRTLMWGQPGFFNPNLVNPWSIVKDTPDNISFYSVSPLEETLNEVIDFDYLNQAHTRLSVIAVNVETGEKVKFDNTEMKLTAKHIMASGALPPGFPSIEIDGCHYWDGGIYSNTPLPTVFSDNRQRQKELLCFSVHLFSPKGVLPHSLDGVLERAKDIEYSSNAKNLIDAYSTVMSLRTAIKELEEYLPEEIKQKDNIKDILDKGHAGHIQLVKIDYRSPTGTELHSKDYEFSKNSLEKHRAMGYERTMEILDEAPWVKECQLGKAVKTYCLKDDLFPFAEDCDL